MGIGRHEALRAGVPIQNTPAAPTSAGVYALADKRADLPIEANINVSFTRDYPIGEVHRVEALGALP
jgi:hypothetical protein